MTEICAIDLHIWSLAPPCPPQLRAHLNAEEEARAARFIRPEDSAAYRIGRGRLREILGAATGCAPGDLALSYGAHGKPALPHGPRFNLSHSGGWAALAVTDAPVDLGLDIERHRGVEPGVAHRFFSRAENAALAPLTGGAWTQGFYRCWTQKEAVVKALGDGLSLPLAEFDVTLDPSEPAAVTRVAPRLGHASDWHLTRLELGPDFSGALALRPALRPQITWHGATPPVDLAKVHGP